MALVMQLLDPVTNRFTSFFMTIKPTNENKKASNFILMIVPRR